MPAHSTGAIYAIALALGVVSGMRSMLAVALTGITLWRRHEIAPPLAPATWLARAPVAIILALAALGELVADKLPWVPDRIGAGPLIARIITGALSGAAAAQVGGLTGWEGAGCGAIGAAASTFGMYHLRQWVDRVTGIRDPFIGAGEDVLAFAIAAVALGTLLGT